MCVYDVFWWVYEVGFKVILVMGWLVGWCDHIVRMWLVDFVVGENGVLVYVIQLGKEGMFFVLICFYVDWLVDVDECLEVICW